MVAKFGLSPMYCIKLFSIVTFQCHDRWKYVSASCVGVWQTFVGLKSNERAVVHWLKPGTALLIYLVMSKRIMGITFQFLHGYKNMTKIFLFLFAQFVFIYIFIYIYIYIVSSRLISHNFTATLDSRDADHSCDCLVTYSCHVWGHNTYSTRVTS